MPGSILKLRIYDNDFSGCELFASIDSQKKCFYGKIQSAAKTIDFNRSKHLIASVDFSHPIVNLYFYAKKPHAEFSASKNIYNILIKADSIESNIMESMSILMKSKSNKNVAEIFFTLIVNLSYFSPIRTFTYRANDTRTKPSIFMPDTKFNPSKALSQELSKLSSSKRVKLNYQLSPKQDLKLFDTLSNQVFNETSSSDFGNGSFVASSQVEMITEPTNQSNHSSARKRQNSSFNDSGSFFSSSNSDHNKHINSKEDENVKISQNQNQQINSNLNINSDSNADKLQVERINTPETKNSQSKLADVGKHSVRKPVQWRKGKKPEFLKNDKENEIDAKLPSLDESQSNNSIPVEPTGFKENQFQKQKENVDQKDNENNISNEVKIPELNKSNDQKKNLSPILDILNLAPHLSPRLPHLDHSKISLSVQQQKTDNDVNINKNENIDNKIAQNNGKDDDKTIQNETENENTITIDSEKKSEDQNDTQTSENKKEKESSDDGVIEVLSDDFDKSDNMVSEPEKSSKSTNSKSEMSKSSSFETILDSDESENKKEKSNDNKKEESDSIKAESSESKKEDNDNNKEESSNVKKEESDNHTEDSNGKKDKNEDKKDESTDSDDDDDFF